MKVEVFGSGCARCQAVKKAVRDAAAALGIDVDLVEVKDPAEMGRRGILFGPALAVEGEVRCAGRVPSLEEVRGWLAP